MVAVKKNQPATIQNTNKPVRDGPKMSHQLVGVWSERPAFCENRSQDAFPQKFAPAKIPAIWYLPRNVPPI